MSLLNRIEVSCFLDSSQTDSRRLENWSPDYVGVVFDVRGVNSIIAMENGTGKTSISEAVIAILSRDRDLLTRTRQRMAPKSFNAFSHVRVELLVQHEARQEDIFGKSGLDVPGEKHVLGIYGNSDGTDGVRFYHYRGTLEDCPAATWADDRLRVSMMPNKEFSETLGNLVAARTGKNSLSLEEWYDEVAKYFEPEIVRKLVEYQKKGGGDVNAVFFSVKRRHGEEFDSAFFYQHIAPELLVDAMGFEGEEGEVRFEQTIRISSLKVIQALQSSRAEEKQLADIQKVVNALDEVRTHGQILHESTKNLDNLRSELAAKAAIVKKVVIDTPLPGIPPATLPGDSDAAAIASDGHILIQDHELYIMDRGLSVIFGEEPTRINERAQRNRIENEPCRLTEVLEIPCDIKIERDSRGKPNRLYTAANSLSLVAESTKFASGWDKERAIKTLKAVFEWAETNVFRRKVASADKEISAYRDTVSNSNREIKEGDSRFKELQEELNKFADAQRAHSEMKESRAFLEEELRHPAKTGISVEAEKSSSAQKLDDHRKKCAAFTPAYNIYERFRAEHGKDADPQTIIAELDTKEDAIKLRLNTAEEVLKKNQDLKYTLQKRRMECIRRLGELNSKLEQLKILRGSADKYRDVFGEKNPKNLSETIRKDLATTTSDLGAIEKQLGSMEQQLQALHSFTKKFPGVEPGKWIADRRVKWEEAKESQRMLQGNLQDRKLRRGDLEHFQVAPTMLYREALATAGDGSVPLYQVIETFGLAAKRRETIMTLFSNFLFAPVFKSVDEAIQGARKLHEKTIETPTFVEDELRDFCENEDIHAIEGAAYTYFVGIRTRPVECLLDPRRVEKEKIFLDKEIISIEADIRELSDLLRELDPESGATKQAQAADQALYTDAKGQETRLLEKKSLLAAKKFELEEQRNNDHLIRDTVKYIAMGGTSRLTEVSAEIDSLTLEDKTSESQTVPLEETIAVNRQERDATASEYQQFLKVTGSKAAELNQVVSFLDVGGPAFMETTSAVEAELKAADDQAGFRHSFKFAMAQQYVDYGEHKADEVNNSIQLLLVHMEELKKKISECEELIGTLLKRREKFKSDAVWLDEKAVSLVTKYREVKATLQSSGIDATSSDMPEDATLITQIRSITETSDLEDEEVRQIFAKVCSDITGFKIETLSSDIKSSEKTFSGAKNIFEKAIDSMVQDGTLDLKEVERSHLIDAKDDVTKVEIMHTKLSAQLKTRLEAHEVTQKAATEAREKLSDRLDILASRLKINFDLFRRVVKFKKDESGGEEAGFEVTATMRPQEEVLGIIELIIRKIEADIEERERSNQSEKSIFEFNKDEHDSIDVYIRDTFYRYMFIDPKIRVYFPSMKSGKTFRFSYDPDKGNLSQGQRAALSLLWIIKFAEFAIEREVNMQNTSSASRRRLRSQKERVFLIDGLFSSLTSKAYIKEALGAVNNIRGKFQMIGLVHNMNHQIDRDIFPTYYIAHRMVKPGERKGIVLVENGNNPITPEQAGRKPGGVVAFGLHYDKERRGKNRRN